MKGKSIIAGIIPISMLQPHPDNPRKDVGDITELSESIKKNGIMQNLTVIENIDKETGDASNFTVLIGHRRMAAAKKAGLTEVPCKVLRGDAIPSHAEQIAIMLEENMQRQDLTIWEQAESFQLCLDLGGDIDTLKEKTGFSASTIRHRLQIAKLDKKRVEELEKKESFQLSISDLIELEKIEDVNKRNKILNECYSRENLKYSIQSEIRLQQRQKLVEPVIKMLEAQGIKEAEKNVHYYTGGYEEIKHIGGPEELKKFKSYTYPNPEDIKAGKVFWKDEGSFYILKKVDTAKQDHAKKKEDIKKHERMEEFEEEWNKFKFRMLDCVLLAMDGKVKADCDDNTIIEDIWTAIMCCRENVNSSTAEWITRGRKNQWSCTNEEKEESHKKYKKLPMVLKMLSVVGHYLDNYMFSPLYGNMEHNKEAEEKACSILNVLYHYGFVPTDHEISMICGTHPIYKKKEQA